MAEGVTLRDYVDRALGEVHRRIDELLAASQRERDRGDTAIEKRLDEGRLDRDRIREAHGNFVTKVEFDLLAARTATLERALARVYGALAVIVFLAGAVGVLIKFLTG